MDLPVIVSILVGISGMILGWVGKSQQVKQKAHNEGVQDGAFKVDMEYLKRGIDAVQVEQKLQAKLHSELREQNIRTDESVKQAHKRIDRLEVEVNEIKKG